MTFVRLLDVFYISSLVEQRCLRCFSFPLCFLAVFFSGVAPFCFPSFCALCVGVSCVPSVRVVRAFPLFSRRADSLIVLLSAHPLGVWCGTLCAFPVFVFPFFLFQRIELPTCVPLVCAFVFFLFSTLPAAFLDGV